MKLSKKDYTVLEAICLDADESVAAIADRTKLKSHTVRSVIARLHDSKLIRRYPFINVFRLGYTPYLLYFALNTSANMRREDVVNSLIQIPAISWLADVGGDFEYCAAILAKDLSELKANLELIGERVGSIFAAKSLVTQTALDLFRTKQFDAKSEGVRSLEWKFTAETEVVDSTDKSILSGLIHSNVQSVAELARTLRVPATTLDARIKRLKERKIIVGFIYLINSPALGLQNHKLLVAVKGYSSQFESDLRRFYESHTAIRSLVSCIGEWDFEIGIEHFDSKVIIHTVSEIKKRFGALLEKVQLISLFAERKVACFPFS